MNCRKYDRKTRLVHHGTAEDTEHRQFTTTDSSVDNAGAKAVSNELAKWEACSQS